MNGPHFKFRVGSGAAPGAGTSSVPTHALLEQQAPVRTEAPPPIEPGSGSVGLRIALVLGLGIAIGLASWFWASAH